MSPTTTLADVRPTLQASILASALALVVLALAASPATAATSLNAEVIDGTLRVTGSAFAEQIALRLSPLDPNQLQVDAGDDGTADHSFDLSAIRAIEVEADNGNDTVRIDQVNGAFTIGRATRIDAGNGDDTLIGGSGAEVFIGGNGDDFVDGNAGVDTAFLGRGEDVFVWDPGDASDVVEGDSGSDTMVFNGAAGNEVMAATASGARVLFTRSPGNIVMDLDGIEVIDVRTLAGTDTVTVNDLGDTDVERLDVDLVAAIGGSTGDGQADTVTVVGTTGDDTIFADANGAAVDVSGLAAFVRIAHADPAADTLIIDALAGADEVTLDPALAGLILVTVL
jgi:Ca2+-binding RTX toxin-like protein